MVELEDWIVVVGEPKEASDKIEELMKKGYYFTGSERLPDGKIRAVAWKDKTIDRTLEL